MSKQVLTQEHGNFRQESMTNRPTYQQTDRPGHREITLPIKREDMWQQSVSMCERKVNLQRCYTHLKIKNIRCGIGGKERTNICIGARFEVDLYLVVMAVDEWLMDTILLINMMNYSFHKRYFLGKQVFVNGSGWRRKIEELFFSGVI